MNRFEPPLCGSSLVLIGQNSRGQWVAQEQSGLFGGLFKNRIDAVRYALFENGRHAEAIVETTGLLELNTSASSVAIVRLIEQTQRHVA